MGVLGAQWGSLRNVYTPGIATFDFALIIEVFTFFLQFQMCHNSHIIYYSKKILISFKTKTNGANTS